MRIAFSLFVIISAGLIYSCAHKLFGDKRKIEAFQPEVPSNLDEYKYSIEQLADISSDADLNKATKFIPGLTVRFFELSSEFLIKIQKNGTILKCPLNSQSGAVTIKDDFFYYIWDTEKYGIKTPKVLMRLSDNCESKPAIIELGPKIGENFETNSHLARYDMLVKFKQKVFGASGGYTPSILEITDQKFKVSVLDEKIAIWGAASSDEQVYIWGLKDREIMGIWRFSASKPELLEKIELTPDKNIWNIEITYDKISNNFIIIYELMDKEDKRIDADDVYRVAIIDKNKNIREIDKTNLIPGLTRGWSGSERPPSVASGVYFDGTYFAEVYEIQDTSVVAINKNQSKTLWVNEDRDAWMTKFSYFKIGQQVYAAEKYSKLLYRLDGVGVKWEKIADNKHLAGESLEYYHNANSIFWYTSVPSIHLYSLDTNTRKIKDIKMPEVESITITQLCNKAYLLIKNKSGVAEMAELSVGNNIEPLKNIPKLLNANIIPSNNENMFLLAGQQKNGGLWKNWSFSCRMNAK